MFSMYLAIVFGFNPFSFFYNSGNTIQKTPPSDDLIGDRLEKEILSNYSKNRLEAVMANSTTWLNQIKPKSRSQKLGKFGIDSLKKSDQNSDQSQKTIISSNFQNEIREEKSKDILDISSSKLSFDYKDGSSESRQELIKVENSTSSKDSVVINTQIYESSSAQGSTSSQAESKKAKNSTSLVSPSVKYKSTLESSRLANSTPIYSGGIEKVDQSIIKFDRKFDGKSDNKADTKENNNSDPKSKASSDSSSFSKSEEKPKEKEAKSSVSLVQAVSKSSKSKAKASLQKAVESENKSEPKDENKAEPKIETLEVSSIAVQASSKSASSSLSSDTTSSASSNQSQTQLAEQFISLSSSSSLSVERLSNETNQAASESQPSPEPVMTEEEIWQNKINAEYSDWSVEDFKESIQKRCEYYGCNSSQLIRVAWCESKFDPYVVGSGRYHGLFQFYTPTFLANSKRVGITNPNIYNPYQQIEVATYMFANGQARQWGCK